MKSTSARAFSRVKPPITSARPGSPPFTSSTLMTSAPQSASAAPALGGEGAPELDAGRRCRAEERAPRQQPLEPQVGVVLPRVADAAEDLDRGVGDGRQLSRVCLGAYRRQVALGRLCGVRRPERV
jgi:hypothetical protein